MGELLKAVTGAIIMGVANLLSFIPGVSDEILEAGKTLKDNVADAIDSAVEGATSAVNVAATALITGNASMIVQLAKALGVVSDDAIAEFVLGVTTSIKTVFGDETSTKVVEFWAEKMLKQLEILDKDVQEKIDSLFGGEAEGVGAIITAGETGAEQAAKESEKQQRGFWFKVMNVIGELSLFLLGPVGDAIDKFGLEITNFFRAAIGKEGLVGQVQYEIEAFDRDQAVIVSPIQRLIAAFKAEVDAFNNIQVRNVSVAGGGGIRRYSRSR